ncbi:uncharacterized protein EI90DRAFT_3079043 [Cantharellus anzutake]|uniref:uncharacterized protein n=1 Tax=Cantharellus anzutake TaxID=1750568 RepID=UPI0019047802|nr:uncharacterized protein EI90DRAFT_3079043 [Cantharellus anzutake]KAF8321870.1 hypothetical protein EI90DRAFT_3079043 [Cantharellus anzutake]
MRIECMSCPIRMVKGSSRAQECLQEVRTLASSLAGRTGITLLPVTRQFLSDLQLVFGSAICRDPATLAPSTIASSLKPPNNSYGWPSGGEGPLPNDTSSFRVRSVQDSPATHHIHSAPLPSPGYASNGISEWSILSVGPLAHPPHVPSLGTSSFTSTDSAFRPSASSSPQVTPNPGIPFNSEQWTPTTLGTSHVDYDLPGPSHLPPYPRSNAFMAEANQGLLEEYSDSGSDAVIWLRGLARSMGYRLVPL